MRLHLLLAVSLVTSLHLLAPLLEPHTLMASALPGHLGETVAVEGRVSDVTPGERVTAVEVWDASGRVRVLTRDVAEVPLGAWVRVVGDPAAGRDGLVLWASGPIQVLEAPDSAPQALPVVLARAPELVGTTVAVRGAVEEDAEHLADAGGRLALRLLTEPPPPGRVVVWGVLDYDEASGSYRLDATGWRAWDPSPS